MISDNGFKSPTVADRGSETLCISVNTLAPGHKGWMGWLIGFLLLYFCKTLSLSVLIILILPYGTKSNNFNIYYIKSLYTSHLQFDVWNRNKQMSHVYSFATSDRNWEIYYKYSYTIVGKCWMHIWQIYNRIVFEVNLPRLRGWRTSLRTRLWQKRA